MVAENNDNDDALESNHATAAESFEREMQSEHRRLDGWDELE